MIRRHMRVAIAYAASASATAAKSQNVIALLRERGLVQDVTSPELEQLAGATSLKIYCGFDPTADSLHLGNLLGILVLAWFQR
jgi:tyrosyl-tRNA synthetase